MLNGPGHFGVILMIVRTGLNALDFLRSTINLFPDQFLFHRGGFFSCSNHQFIKLSNELSLCVIVRRYDIVKMLGRVYVALNNLEVSGRTVLSV